jgi:hypothetical protein
MQIEIQFEKLRTIHDHFLNEIEVYETNCVRQFGSNDQFKNRMDGFLNEADEMSAKIENSESDNVENQLFKLKDRSKIMLEELENEKFQGLPIEFNSRNFIPTLATIGYMIYRKSGVILKGLNEMNSIDLTGLGYSNTTSRFSFVRLSSNEFVAAFISKNSFGCIKFDNTGKQLKSLINSGALVVIQTFKIYKSDSY